MRSCRTPACFADPDTGGRFCPEHKALYARVRGELEASLKEHGQWGKAHRSRKKRPTCCRPGCDELRIGTAAFCDGCAAAGYVEEDAA